MCTMTYGSEPTGREPLLDHSEPWRNRPAANRTNVISLGQIVSHPSFLDVALNLGNHRSRIHIDRFTVEQGSRRPVPESRRTLGADNPPMPPRQQPAARWNHFPWMSLDTMGWRGWSCWWRLPWAAVHFFVPRRLRHPQAFGTLDTEFPPKAKVVRSSRVGSTSFFDKFQTNSGSWKLPSKHTASRIWWAGPPLLGGGSLDRSVAAFPVLGWYRSRFDGPAVQLKMAGPVVPRELLAESFFCPGHHRSLTVRGFSLRPAGDQDRDELAPPAGEEAGLFAHAAAAAHRGGRSAPEPGVRSAGIAATGS